MRDFFRTKAFIFIIAALVLSIAVFCFTAFTEGSISLTANAAGIILTPFQKAAHSVGNFFDNVYGFIFRYNSLSEENAALKEELKNVKDKLREAQAALDENARLRELLDLKQKNRSLEFEIAEIIAVSTGNWNTVFTIDKGSFSDISVNDCVITEDGMVGYISEVGATFSEVITVLDPSMQAGAIVSRTRDVAVAQGSFDLMDKGLLKLSYIKKENDIIPGDTVETSGLGEVFPKGILIGTVERILPEAHGISNYAIVKPAVDLNNITKVFIVKRFEITE